MAAPRKPFNRAWRRHWIIHPLHGGAVYAVFAAIRLIPVDTASAIGAWLGRRLGPLVRRPNRRALANLALAFPDLSEADRRGILLDMWGHLGRVAAEYPHLVRLAKSDRIEVAGYDLGHRLLTSGKPVIFFSGHIGHWEVGPVLGARFGIRTKAVYRPPNNRFVDRMTRRIREQCGLDLLVRGAESVQAVIGALRDGSNLALLVDQKRSYGIPVPFFGRPALTGTVLAQLALRIDCEIVPIRVERTDGARFRVTCCEPIAVDRSADRSTETLRIMTAVNGELEAWIRERPEQWLWPHRRWDP